MIKLAISIVSIFFTAGVLHAGPISVSGDFTLIAPPTSVLPGALESSTTAWAFAEQQNVTLASDLMVDQLMSGGSAGTIASGTTINSFFLHFDPVGDQNRPQDVVTVSGSLTFESAIIAVIWGGVACANCPASTMYLDTSDYLGDPGVAYPTGGLGRGLETEDYYSANGTQDFVISADYRTISVSLSAFPLRSDQLRIITRPLPEPGTLWLISIGLAFLLRVSHRAR